MANSSADVKVAIVGAGIGGLTLALELHDAGIPCRVFESVQSLEAVGVGINLLPHATQVLARHGVLDELATTGVTTRESVFFNRFGQLIHREASGRYAGYASPQFSIHRADLQRVLVDAVRARLGPDGVVLGHRCTGVSQDTRGATVHFREGPGDDGADLPDERAEVVVACDGIHSVIRRQLHPVEGPPRYSGVTMWRGVSVWQPFLTGASMVRAGWLATGKMVVYPIRNDVDVAGNQLVNWVAEVERPQRSGRDWTRMGRVEDFIGHFEDWQFDWLDVPGLVGSSDQVLEYPMVDQDPLDRWSDGRVTLLGDAAHPMVPRGSNGAGQAILDARALTEALVRVPVPVAALADYEATRLPATAQVVLTNRSSPPDILLKEVWERTGDRPFETIEGVISAEEIRSISESYKRVAGYSRAALDQAAE